MDPDTGKVNAPEEVWAEFYMKNKREYKSIRKEGCDHFHILSEVFSGTTATGDMHRASTQLPPTSDEERELEEAFINRGDFNDQEPIPIDSSQTAQMGSIRDEIASNMWNDYTVTSVGFDFVMLVIIGLYLIVLFTVLVIATRGFDELLLMIRRPPTRKSKVA
ncbi:hypothetical protein ZIOFF_035666 [Zingiber officinale]|uniref:Uncharacterized protein n=1 Tax=Zingiber officinale TaxID=94328 RepID=A0A8J5GEX7_ZINOF|nr:hypothetical protein ZIOFF_035666 [Zingiber officinale]